MNGFSRNSRNAQVWCYQKAGGRAVRLEVRGFWREAAEAWQQAASIAPRTAWQQFARKRAEQCHLRCRSRW
ncbi:hypothetical protein E4T96_24840 [Shigella flexneri]|uniref:hypothetical protein n=1 Tax=Enterobacteriaceae TaxID=543 RepID=UPI000B7C7B97|nr:MULTISPECIES: hypothetical protein [Enterobacteriaceae]KAB3085510.1 hypothetical protein F9222_23870 [Escherichia coli]MEC9584139.1 hypothetical protein [Escherichia coli]TFU68882.1 hypothetical protein E4T96_24840 [Shigella flexneri]